MKKIFVMMMLVCFVVSAVLADNSKEKATCEEARQLYTTMKTVYERDRLREKERREKERREHEESYKRVDPEKRHVLENWDKMIYDSYKLQDSISQANESLFLSVLELEIIKICGK